MAKVSDIKIREDDYWIKRAEALNDRNGKKGDLSEREIRKLFKDANSELDREIQAFYAKYGSIQAAPTFKTLSDGSTVVSGINSRLVVPQNVAGKALTKGTRLTSLQGQLTEILKGLSKQENDIMSAALAGVARDQYYDTFYELHKGIGIGNSFNLLTESTVKSLIHNEVNGADFSTRIWDNTDKLATTVNQTLKAGITQGLSNQEMAKRIANTMASGTKVANRLLRTEVTNSLNQASLLSYENSGIVKQYEYIATLDERTSVICMDLDGSAFDVKEATAGLNFPPMHPNCRSTTGAKFDNSKEGLTRIARDLGGNNFYVPATMSVRDYRAIYVDNTLTRKDWDKGKRAK